MLPATGHQTSRRPAGLGLGELSDQKQKGAARKELPLFVGVVFVEQEPNLMWG